MLWTPKGLTQFNRHQKKIGETTSHPHPVLDQSIELKNIIACNAIIEKSKIQLVFILGRTVLYA